MNLLLSFVATVHLCEAIYASELTDFKYLVTFLTFELHNHEKVKNGVNYLL